MDKMKSSEMKNKKPALCMTQNNLTQNVLKLSAICPKTNKYKITLNVNVSINTSTAKKSQRLLNEIVTRLPYGGREKMRTLMTYGKIVLFWKTTSKHEHMKIGKK